MIINKDCLEALKELPDNSIDAIVTDPPYHLVSVTKRFGGKNAHNTPAMETEEGGVFARKAKGFMGKDWDGVDETGLGIAQKVELWEECLRVLKPGGYLLAFSGTRTTHRMTVAIEDAGFEIRDMIAWVYGSGFPKSLNIGKAVDKLQGNERVSEMVKGKIFTGSNNNINGEAGEYEVTKGTSPWEGWGTALKPALEPITVARKPIEGTVAENCLKWGVGGINIDESRVEMPDRAEYEAKQRTFKGATGKVGENSWKNSSPLNDPETSIENSRLGRFPANLIHDGSEEVLELFPETKSGGRNIKSNHTHWGSGSINADISNLDSQGSAARFFYCAKASKSERNLGCDGLEEKIQNNTETNSRTFNDRCLTCKKKFVGSTNTICHCPSELKITDKTIYKNKNNHPTVKPIKLMEYLINLVSKPGHTVLDPFAGSGTTGIACKKLNRNFIGIERDEEYCKIAEARINNLTL